MCGGIVTTDGNSRTRIAQSSDHLSPVVEMPDPRPVQSSADNRFGVGLHDAEPRLFPCNYFERCVSSYCTREEQLHDSGCEWLQQMASAYRLSNDSELLQAFARTPDEKDEIFKEIYSRYSQKLYSYCMRMTSDQDDANDLFQETFLRFYRHKFGDEVVVNLLSYLLVSARNIFLNTRRTTSRWTPFNGHDPVIQVPMYEREELLNMIHTALELLTVPYREAFILRFYQGMSYRSMAEITGDSIASLKVRVMRAKDQIRHILAPYINDISKS